LAVEWVESAHHKGTIGEANGTWHHIVDGELGVYNSIDTEFEENDMAHDGILQQHFN
jgi:hypothetical protein